MIRKGDVQWWVLEAKKHPESAPAIIEELANRLAELDAENERLRDEAIRQQHTPATAEATAAASGDEVKALQDRIAALQALLNGQTPSEPSAILFSDQLLAARVPLSQAHRLAREERPVLGKHAAPGPRCLALACPHEELLLLTSQGRGVKVLPADLPPLAEGGNWPTAEKQGLAADERLMAAVTVAEHPRFWTIATRRGFVRQLIRIDFDRRVERGEPLIESPFRNDAPVSLANGDQGDLLLITRWGKGVRFPQRAIEGQGSIALELEPDDEVVAALALPSDARILVLTAAGFAVWYDTTRLGARTRPGGKGKALIQAYDVLGAFPGEPQAQLLYLTYSGKLVFAAVDDIPLHTRSRKGARVRTFDRDPAVAVTLVPAS